MHSFLLKLFEIDILLSYEHQPSSLPLELTDRFLYKGKACLKLIKIQLCEAKMSVVVVRVRSRTPATSKMEIFVTIFKEKKLSKIVINSIILDVTDVRSPV